MTNLMKTVALTSALALAGTSAYAVNEFALQDNVMEEGTITIENVTADGAGTVVIYDYNAGEFGEVLGMAEVAEGANRELQIILDQPPVNDVAAVLYVGEVTDPSQAAAWIELDVNDS